MDWLSQFARLTFKCDINDNNSPSQKPTLEFRNRFSPAMICAIYTLPGLAAYKWREIFLKFFLNIFHYNGPHRILTDRVFGQNILFGVENIDNIIITQFMR